MIAALKITASLLAVLVGAALLWYTHLPYASQKPQDGSCDTAKYRETILAAMTCPALRADFARINALFDEHGPPGLLGLGEPAGLQSAVQGWDFETDPYIFGVRELYKKHCEVSPGSTESLRLVLYRSFAGRLLEQDIEFNISDENFADRNIPPSTEIIVGSSDLSLAVRSLAKKIPDAEALLNLFRNGGFVVAERAMTNENNKRFAIETERNQCRLEDRVGWGEGMLSTIHADDNGIIQKTY